MEKAQSSTRTEHRMRGAILAMLGGICWGFSGTCGQFLFTRTAVTVEFLSCIRMVFAGGLLILFGLLRHPKNMVGIWKSRGAAVRLLLFSLCGLLVCQYTYLKAISFSNAGTATVLQYLAPIMIVGLVCLRARRLPTKRELGALVLALLGVFLLATHGNPGTLALSGRALIWGLAAAVGLTLYSILPGNLIREWGSMTVTGYGLLIAGIVSCFLMRVWNYVVPLDANAILGILGMTIPGTVIAYTLYLQGVADVGADHASLFSCTEPVAATVFAALWMGTQFLPVDLAGFAVILLAVILLSTARNKT